MNENSAVLVLNIEVSVFNALREGQRMETLGEEQRWVKPDRQ